MNTVSRFKKIAQHWRAFGRAEDGNVAVIFALSLIPLLGLIGGAIDYSRASAMRVAMQTAADATALAISRDDPDRTATQLQTDANNYFNAVFDQSDTNGIKVDAKFTKSPDQRVVIDVSGNVTSYFMRIWPFNITEIPVSVSSTTLWSISNGRLRIALALDNTGSMSSKNKMEKLKEATYELIDQLAAVAAKSGDVYVSVIPFSVDVNVGKDNRSASWIDWTDWEAENGSCSKSSYKSKRKCERRNGTWTPDNRSTWNGCIADRDKNNDVSNLAPDPDRKSTLFPADQYAKCPSELVALTDLASVDPENNTNVDKLKDRVKDMYPAGNTNITIGLAWAWQSLTQTAPLHAPLEDSEYVYRNIIILLTDGKNTENRFTGSTSKIDERTEKICNDIKAVKKDEALVYRIYAIRVIDGNASLLKQCASDPDEYDDKYYYDVESADEIKGAFADIASKLSNLRLEK